MVKWACLLLAALAGCHHDVYEVDMAVEGNQIIRSYSRHIEGGDMGRIVREPPARDANLPPASVPAMESVTRTAVDMSDAPPQTMPATTAPWRDLAAVYKLAPESNYPWKGRFAGRTPDDVGGAGGVAFFPSDMGGTWIYLERFRGDPDPAAALEERLRAADTLSVVIAGWARARLGDRKGFDKLGAFLDGDFHKDAKNLALLLWTAGAVRHMSTLQPIEANSLGEKPYFMNSVPFILSSAQVDVAAIVVQYLVERKYVDLEDAPAIIRYFRGASDERKAAIAKELWRKILTRRIGVTDKDLLEHLVGIFDRGEEAKASFMSYVEGCKEYKDYLARLPKERSSDGPPGWKDPTPDGFQMTLGYVAFTPAGFNIMNNDDELRLTLVTNEVPILTNGTWDANAGKLSWQRRFLRESPLVSDPLPAVCYAVWSRAEEGFQKKHFGKTILRGPSLLEYCLWRRGLTAAEAKQWDIVMAAIKPETDFHALVESSAQAPTTQPAGGTLDDVIAAGLRILDAAARE